MTENEYILVTNLIRVGIAKDCVARILPDKIIDSKELSKIVNRLATWEIDMFEVINLEPVI